LSIKVSQIDFADFECSNVDSALFELDLATSQSYLALLNLSILV